MKESKATLDLYGVGEQETDNFGRKCLMARRLAEAGVRYIQVTDNGWDHHDKINTLLAEERERNRQAVAGLLTDLKARGLLDDTLVIWTGEFGRTPSTSRCRQQEGITPGRDHNPYCWTMFMAGGGRQAGADSGRDRRVRLEGGGRSGARARPARDDSCICLG